MILLLTIKASIFSYSCSFVPLLSITKSNFTPDGVDNFDTSGTFHLAKTVSVPADATLVVLDTPIYMMETDILKGGAGAASDLELFISYESIDDA